MKLVRLETGEIVETNEVIGTELTTLEITQLLTQENSGIELSNRRIEEYGALISNEQSNKMLFVGVPEEVSAINARIAQMIEERKSELAQKSAAQEKVAVYEKYV